MKSIGRKDKDAENEIPSVPGHEDFMQKQKEMDDFERDYDHMAP